MREFDNGRLPTGQADGDTVPIWQRYARQWYGGRPAGGTIRKPGAGRPPQPLRRVDLRCQVRPDVKEFYIRLARYLSASGSRSTSELAELALEHYIRWLGYEEYLDPRLVAKGKYQRRMLGRVRLLRCVTVTRRRTAQRRAGARSGGSE